MDAVEPAPQGCVSYWVVPMSSARHAVCAARRRQADRSWPPQDCRGTTGRPHSDPLRDSGHAPSQPSASVPSGSVRARTGPLGGSRLLDDRCRVAGVSGPNIWWRSGRVVSPPRHRPRLQAGLGTRLTDPQPCRRRADAVIRAGDHSNAAFSPGSSLGRAGREGAVLLRCQHTGQARGGASAWRLERSPPYDAQVLPGIHTGLKRVCSMRCRPCRRSGNPCYRLL